MFKNVQFYHEHIRKAIVAFGMVFNNIRIARDDTAGNIAQVMRVPLAYSTKQKFLSRIALIPDATSRGEVAIVLPRMGFEIQQLTYDPARKVSPIQRNKAVGVGDDANTVRSSFVSTPYNMSVSLYVFAKNQEDGLQIIEQILPFFNPDFNVTVNQAIIKESIAQLYENDKLDTLSVKVSTTAGKNGVTDSTLTPADDFDFITTILESFGE